VKRRPRLDRDGYGEDQDDRHRDDGEPVVRQLAGLFELAGAGRGDVEGLGRIPDWKALYSSVYQGHSYQPFLLIDPYDPIEADPSHERGPIATQMGVPVSGIFPMNGFVANYATAKHATPPVPGSKPPVMGYFSADQAPVTDFFARNFAVCDHWHAALPAGTQPNRLMAMSGYTRIDVNKTGPIPDHYLVYDWLTQHGITWRVYHEELPFFSLLPRLIPQIIQAKNFRPFAEFFSDVENALPGKFPQVVFLEPAYTDAPHLGLSSDDHAPSAIKGGQEFLLEVYRAIRSEPTLWSGMVAIVTYDEHGGFFDHVSPPLIATEPPPHAEYTSGPFKSLGVRVPAFVISPFVQPGTTFSGLLDHTSILKLIGEVFGDGRYLPLVDQRPVGSVLDVLADHEVHAAPNIDSLDKYRAKQAGMAGFVPGSAPDTPLQHAFQDALDCIRAQPTRPQGKIGDLLDVFPPRPALQQ